MKRRGRDVEPSVVNMPKRRRELVQELGEVLAIAFDKYNNSRTKNSERQSWGRLIVSALEAQAAVVKDFDLDDLKARLDRLEALKEVKVNGTD